MNKRVVIVGGGIRLGASMAAALINAGSRNIAVEPAHIEQAKRIERAYVQSGRRVKPRGKSFKQRIADMQARATVEACVKNARRKYNRENGK